MNVSEKIVFAGFIPDEELKQYYKQSNVFALPSLYEGFGLVYIDALANKLPIVTTKCGGPEDIINKTNRILVPIRNHQAFAEAIITSLKKN